MKLNSRFVAILVVAVVLGGVLVLKITGLWLTESTKVAAKFTTGELAGISNPADIRGSYSFTDVETNFGVGTDVLARAFAVDVTVKPAGDWLAKDLETLYGEVAEGAGEIGTDSIRWFVSLWMGIAYAPEETTYLPSPALSLLREEAKISEETFQELKDRSVQPSAAGMVVLAEDHDESSTDTTIKGITTFADLLSWGLTQQQIEEILGNQMPSRTTKLRDYFVDAGLEYSTYRTRFQEALDALE